MTIDKLQPGMTVYDVQRYRMGNTTIRTVGVYDVSILAVDIARGVVRARWNGNSPRDYYSSEWSRWRKKKPTLISTGFFGQQRLAKRGEAADNCEHGG